MSRYSYIPQPNPVTSPVYGQATRLVPVPSYGAQMPVAAAAAAPAAAAGTRSLGMAFLSDVLANMLAGGVQAATAGATGALTPATTQGGSSSRFMITLADLRDIHQYVDNENWKRRLTGRGDDLLSVEDMLRDREAQLRRSAAEAGAREYAIEQLKQQGAIQSALAGTAGQALTSAGGVIQQGLSSLGGVAQQGISSALSRPDYGSMISEIGRAY